jgi:predicted nucleic acid-binding protein
MRTVFADAAYWIALLNPRDSLHGAALRASNSLAQTRIVTSEMVLVEVLNSLAKPTELRSTVVVAVVAIQADPNAEVVPLSGIQFRDALRFYQAHADKE